MHELNQQQVVVVGAGQSGISACRFLHKLGAYITLVDDAPYLTVEDRIQKLGGLPSAISIASQNNLNGVVLVVLSPGIPLTHSLISAAREKNIPVINEIDLAASHLSGSHFIGITGTNGKSTTTTILGCIAKEFHSNTFVGGNLGLPLCEALARGENPKYVVLELSSFQLELISQLKLDAAVLTNLSPDHLDRYASVEDYYHTKERIFDLLTPHGVAIRGPHIVPPEFHLNPNYYMGEHNRENAAAAIAAARAWKIPDDIIQRGLDKYHGIAHRLELLGEINGVQWINDSKATNIESVLVALKSLTRNTHLILGGLGKGASYQPLVEACQNHIKAIYVIGRDAPAILEAFRTFPQVIHAHTLEKAVDEAQKRAIAGELILLSPACASYDQFENYVKRGEAFRSLYEKNT